MWRDCAFFPDDGQCASRSCAIDECDPAEFLNTCHGHSSGKIDSSLDSQTFQVWAEDGDPWTNDAEVMNNGENMNYVDLSKNPERFTGYSGPSAARIWNAIYDENCFVAPEAAVTSDADIVPGFTSPHAEEQCLEKRVFYRIISGLHSSISTHLCHDYSYDLSSQVFETNVDRFYETVAKYPVRVHNLYLTYLMVLRAISKALPALQTYSPPNSPIQDLLVQLSQISTACPNTFDENAMFQGPDAPLLKSQFKNHFRNISVILDCVACERCKLWGKLQINGLGTALRILFDVKQQPDAGKLNLERTELVALIHTFRRLSESLKWSNEMFQEYRAKHATKEEIKLPLDMGTTTERVVAEIVSSAFGGDRGADDGVQDMQHAEPYTNHDQSQQYNEQQPNEVVDPIVPKTTQDEHQLYVNKAYANDDYNETEELEYQRLEMERAAQENAAAQQAQTLPPITNLASTTVETPTQKEEYNETEELEYLQHLREEQARAQRASLEQQQQEQANSAQDAPQVIEQSAPVAETVVDSVPQTEQVPTPTEQAPELPEVIDLLRNPPKTPDVPNVLDEFQVDAQQATQDAIPSEQAPTPTEQAPELPEVIDMLRNPPKTPDVPDVLDGFQVDAQAASVTEQAPTPIEQAPELPEVIDMLRNPPKTPDVPDVLDGFQVESQQDSQVPPTEQAPELPEVIDMLRNPPKTPYVPDVLDEFQADAQPTETQAEIHHETPVVEDAPELPTPIEMLQNPPPTPIIPDVNDDFQAEIQDDAPTEQENMGRIPDDMPTPIAHLETPPKTPDVPEVIPPTEDYELYTADAIIPPLPEVMDLLQNPPKTPDVPDVNDVPLRMDNIDHPHDHISVAGATTHIHHHEEPEVAEIQVTSDQVPIVPPHQGHQHQDQHHQEQQHQQHQEHQHQTHNDHSHHSHEHGHDHGHDHGNDHGHSHMMGMDGMGLGMGDMGMDGHGHGGHGGHGHGVGNGRDLSSEHMDDTWSAPQPEGFDAFLATMSDTWTVVKVAVRNFYTRVVLPAVKENSSMYSALAIISPIFIFFVLALRRKVEVSVPFGDPIGASPSKKRSNQPTSFAPAPAFTRPDAQVQAPHTPSKGVKDDGARSRRTGPISHPPATTDPSLPFAPPMGAPLGAPLGAPMHHTAPAKQPATSRRAQPTAGPAPSPFAPGPGKLPSHPPASSSAAPVGKSPSKMPQPAPVAAPSAPVAAPSEAPVDPLINTTTPPPFNTSALPSLPPPGARSGAPKAAAAAAPRRRIPVPEPLKK